MIFNGKISRPLFFNFFFFIVCFEKKKVVAVSFLPVSSVIIIALKISFFRFYFSFPPFPFFFTFFFLSFFRRREALIKYHGNATLIQLASQQRATWISSSKRGPKEDSKVCKEKKKSVSPLSCEVCILRRICAESGSWPGSWKEP